MSNDADLEALRRELVNRFNVHPPSTWSRKLLTVVVGAIDLQFGVPQPEVTGQRLRLAPDPISTICTDRGKWCPTS